MILVLALKDFKSSTAETNAKIEVENKTARLNKLSDFAKIIQITNVIKITGTPPPNASVPLCELRLFDFANKPNLDTIAIVPLVRKNVKIIAKKNIKM